MKIRLFFLYWAAAASSIARAAAPPVSFDAPLGYLTGNPYLGRCGRFQLRWQRELGGRPYGPEALDTAR